MVIIIGTVCTSCSEDGDLCPCGTHPECCDLGHVIEDDDDDLA